MSEIKNYAFQGKLGSGTYATVYKAHRKVYTFIRWLLIGRFYLIITINASNLTFFPSTNYRSFLKRNPSSIVAIKCIERKRLNSKSVENLAREIELLKQLNHEHIVNMLDFHVRN